MKYKYLYNKVFKVMSLQKRLNNYIVETCLVRLRFFREGFNFFWRGGDPFGSVWDFFVRGWDYFRGVEFVQGI